MLVQVAIRELPAKRLWFWQRPSVESNAHLREVGLSAFRLFLMSDHRSHELVRCARRSDLVNKTQVGAAHVIEQSGQRGLMIGFGFCSRLDFDDDLHWSVQTVEQSPERVKPALAIVIGGVGKAERSCCDDDGVMCAG